MIPTGAVTDMDNSNKLATPPQQASVEREHFAAHNIQL
jgi:hypothetical protein